MFSYWIVIIAFTFLYNGDSQGLIQTGLCNCDWG